MGDIIPQIPPQSKQCVACLNFYPSTSKYFHTRKNGTKDGLRNVCRTCRNNGNRVSKSQVPDGYKQCSRCQQELPATSQFFYRNASSSDGFRPNCKTCVNAEMKSKRDESRPPTPVIPIGYKQCPTCKQIKQATSEFYHRNTYSSDGWMYHCKSCSADYNRSRYTPKRPPLPVVREGYKVCNSCGKAYPATTENFSPHKSTRDKLKHECRACHSVWGKQYRMKPEVKERSKKNAQIYEKNHKDARRARYHKRRARKNSVKGTHTAEQVRQQYDRQKGKCYYCRDKVKWGDHHIEHTFPLSRVADTDIPANNIEYLVIACRHCNLSKGNRFPWEWAEGGRLF